MTKNFTIERDYLIHSRNYANTIENYGSSLEDKYKKARGAIIYCTKNTRKI